MAQIKKAYLDANVFISGALDGGENGDKARRLLGRIQRGEIEAFTSVLSIDEIYYKILNSRSREVAQACCEGFLTLRGLSFMDATRWIVTKSMDLLRESKLLPRDAIHLASMDAGGLSVIISEDRDFDQVKSIKRLGLNDV